jgi:hypothetical protein
MNITLAAEILCLLFAIIYKVVAYSKKEKADQQHYHLLSEVYIVGLIIAIAVSQVDKKVCTTKDVKSDTITILNKQK